MFTGRGGYARRIAPDTLVGGAAGVGFQAVSLVLAGEHFSDGNNSRSFDFLEGRLLLRQALSERWTLDAGLRAAQVLHVQGRDLEVSDHAFMGAYVTPMFGWRLFQLGPTVSAGVFSRAAGPARPAMSEFGVRLSGLTGRFTFRF